jgi:hypothetical protein
MRVRSEGDADVAVPHEALHAVRVHSAAEELGCEGVAQVVEADGNVQGDGPEPPSACLGEWTAPPIGDLAARRTEARLRIAGAFPVGAPATAVFVTFNDAGAGQGMPENLLRVGLALLWDPSGAGKTRCPGACASWYSIQGRNAVGSGSTAAAPPFVVSRSCERATVIVPRARSTSLFLSAKSSPLRSPRAAHAKRGRQPAGTSASIFPICSGESVR